MKKSKFDKNHKSTNPISSPKVKQKQKENYTKAYQNKIYVSFRHGRVDGNSHKKYPDGEKGTLCSKGKIRELL